MDYDLLFFDRVSVIKDVILKYGEENFYLSFSGGKDSTCLHYLLDYVLPNNRIPRVFIDTGIEYDLIRSFVFGLARDDSRFVILKPNLPIILTLKLYGYPFKSKEHSLKVGYYQNGSRCKSILKYRDGTTCFDCPKCLKYQFEDGFTLKLSNKCCYKLKKDVASKYVAESGRSIAIVGLRMAEGGNRRNHAGCLTFNGGSLTHFKPFNPVDDGFIDFVVGKLDISLCPLYYPPFNFKRTGCKGCPYSLDLQAQLDVMRELLPNEFRQCEIIWKPVYDEYRRIGFRLRKDSL